MKKEKAFYGLMLETSGRISYARIPMESEEKWICIKKLLSASVTRQLAAGGFNGMNRVIVYNYYGAPSQGINERAMKLSGGKTNIYGPALMLRENALGYPALMSEGAAYKMKLEVERGW